jgi:4-hydroxy-tetrahydrodipicolinate synthase
MKKNNPYRGVIVPVVTPLNDDYSVDKTGVGNIVSLLLESSASPFIAGTTGEGSSLSFQQKEVLVKETVTQVGGKGLVYAGISANCLSESIEAAKRFAGLGANVLVANMPSYYPLKDAYTMRYCEQLAEACPMPLIFYNITATTGYSIPLNLMEKLSYHPNIVGLKDSERDQERLDQALILWKDREDFVHLTGWAAMSVYALKNGSDGIVPSTGNFAPVPYVELYEAALAGNWERAGILQQKTNDLSALYQKGRSLSESLASLKVIMSMKKLCGTQMMPPIYPMKDEAEAAFMKEIEKELENF